MGRVKDWLIEQEQKRMEELDEEYQSHDCHASPMDGCRVCEEYRQAIDDRRLCPHGICDGSGKITEGRFDDIREKDCLCEVERKQIDMDDNSDLDPVVINELTEKN